MDKQWRYYNGLAKADADKFVNYLRKKDIEYNVSGSDKVVNVAIYINPFHRYDHDDWFYKNLVKACKYNYWYVTGVNKDVVSCRAGVFAWEIPTTEKMLKDIIDNATIESEIYRRIYQEIDMEWSRRIDKLHKEHHYYSHEEIEEAKDWRRFGKGADKTMERKNQARAEEECKLKGFHDAAFFCNQNKEWHDTLKEQAECVLKGEEYKEPIIGII